MSHLDPVVIVVGLASLLLAFALIWIARKMLLRIDYPRDDSEWEGD